MQNRLKIRAATSLTHIDNVEDQIFLRSKAFPVNMRLFNSNPDYHRLIRYCIDIVKKYCMAEYSDYKKPHGMSGANLAIPFNIIAYLEYRGTPDERCEVMINPEILEHDRVVTKLSNCGSIRLPEAIKVHRYGEILVKYFSENGQEMQAYLEHNEGGSTVQHEIDHNNGILITDRQIK